jgi:hypothetical protein
VATPTVGARNASPSMNRRSISPNPEYSVAAGDPVTSRRRRVEILGSHSRQAMDAGDGSRCSPALLYPPTAAELPIRQRTAAALGSRRAFSRRPASDGRGRSYGAGPPASRDRARVPPRPRSRRGGAGARSVGRPTDQTASVPAGRSAPRAAAMPRSS